MEKNTLLKNNWFDFYKLKVNERYYQYICSKYYRFIYEISNELSSGMIVGEFGCGIGNISIALKIMFPYIEYECIDNNARIMDLCYDQWKRKLPIEDFYYKVWDIRNLYPNKFDLIHSHGILEHFPDNEIQKIIDNQLFISSSLIHYVPSNKYTYQSFGDERLMSKEEWQTKFNPTEIIEFNDGYDLILKWRK